MYRRFLISAALLCLAFISPEEPMIAAQCSHLFYSLFYSNRPFGVATTALNAEWKPADGKWEEKNFEADLKKLEKEAEDRLDAKIAELASKVATTGAK